MKKAKKRATKKKTVKVASKRASATRAGRKNKRECSVCGEPGHNARTCKAS